MDVFTRRLAALAVPLAFAACIADGPADAPTDIPGARVAIEVAALDLPGVGRVCYDVAVENADADTVWTRGTPATTVAAGDADALCSDRWGNGSGGGVTYVGPCDASRPAHTVRLWIDTIEDAQGAALDDWRDPCPSATGCALPATCSENADTAVTFDLTVMRRANQGFFDVAVEFDDIFCSAKLDCTYDDAGTDPITLLHRPDGGGRDQTAVVGFACTAGPDASGTVLHVSDVEVVCGEPVQGSPLPGVPFDEAQVQRANGDVLGTSRLVPEGSQGELIASRPTLWRADGVGGYLPGVTLPTGADRDGAITDRLADDRVFGYLIDDGRDPSTLSIAVWSADASGQWTLTDSLAFADADSASGPVAVNVYAYDPVAQRVFLGPNVQGGETQGAQTIYLWWTIGGDVTLPTPVSGFDGCEIFGVEGDTAAGRCVANGTNAQTPAHWDIATNTVTSLPLLFTPTDPTSVRVAYMGALSDGSVVGLVFDGDTHGRLHHWWRDGATWRVDGVDETDETAQTFHWERDDYLYVVRGGAPMLYRYDGGGSFALWTAATADGAQAQSWSAAGVFPSTPPLVFGQVTVQGEDTFDRYAAAGVLGAPGSPIAFTALPTDSSADYAAITAFGTIGDDVHVVGRGASPLDVTSWRLDPDGDALVADWHPLDPDGLSAFSLMAPSTIELSGARYPALLAMGVHLTQDGYFASV